MALGAVLTQRASLPRQACAGLKRPAAACRPSRALLAPRASAEFELSQYQEAVISE